MSSKFNFLEILEKEYEKQLSRRRVDSVLGILFLAFISIYFPTAQLCNYVNYCNHKNQISLNDPYVIGYTYDPDSVYFDGTRIIQFELMAYVGKYDISSLYIATKIFENGICTGVIRTEFATDIPAHYCGTLNFNVEEHYFIEDDFFNYVYDKSSDGLLEYKTEILYTSFSDGITVGRYSDVHYAYWDENGVKHNDFPD